jgi:hypothetical protein
VGENDFFIPSMDLASEHGVAPVPYFLQFGTTPIVVRTSSKSQKVHLELLLAQRCGCPKCCRPCLCHGHACMFYWARKCTINLCGAPVYDKNAADGISGTLSVFIYLAF